MLQAYIIPALYAIGGLALLVFAADWLVKGAVALARKLGIGELVIGLTIVALGTSAPELFTGIRAALSDNSGIVLGNAVGSNIANLGLVLGASALIRRIPVTAMIAWQDGPIMLFLTSTVYLLLMDGEMSRPDAGILLLMLIFLNYFYYQRAKNFPEAVLPEGNADDLLVDKPDKLPMWQTIGFLLIGLAGLALGAHWLVDGASTLAAGFGVSNTLIGATVVAIGTSAPELAASLAGVKHKSYDLVLGNIVGSCKLNLVAILGIPGLITPLTADPNMFIVHLPALAIISAVVWLMFIGRMRQILRREGVVLLILYVLYIVLSIQFD